MRIREARQSGRPGDKYSVTYMEAGPRRRPHCIQLGSPTMREDHYKDVHRQAGRRAGTHAGRQEPGMWECRQARRQAGNNMHETKRKREI